jgi:hypothetical protein
MVSSPNVPGAVIEDMGPGFWCMLRSMQVLWRLVRKEPQTELSYQSVFGGGMDQAAALGGYVLGFCAFSWARFRVLSNVLHVSTVWFSLPQKSQVLDLLLIFFYFFLNQVGCISTPALRVVLTVPPTLHTPVDYQASPASLNYKLGYNMSREPKQKQNRNDSYHHNK